MKKRIGIDARLYFQTGVGTYLRNFIFYLQKINPVNIEFYLYLLKNETAKINLDKKIFIIRPVESLWHSFGEQTKFLYEIYKDKIDLMHFTYFGYPVLYNRPFISTIHDTTPILFKTGKASTKNIFVYEIKHKIFKYVLETQVKKSLKIITPTKTVKNQLINLYGKLYNNKIIAVYEGVDYLLQKAKENTLLNKKIKKPFFLYVGNFYPHKNIEILIRAFSKIDNKYKLILIGPKDYFAERIFYLISNLKQNNRVIFHYNATPEDLKFFYTHAEGLIHPSLSEGFGLPVLEAAYFNCPVIASNIDVFNELLGRNYISFNPRSEEDLVNKINLFLTKKTILKYNSLIEKYSFEEMTKKTLDVYLSYL